MVDRVYRLGRDVHRHRQLGRRLDRRALLGPGRNRTGRQRRLPDENPVRRQPAVHRLAGRQPAGRPDGGGRRPRAGPGQRAPAGRGAGSARRLAAHRPRPARRSVARAAGAAERSGIRTRRPVRGRFARRQADRSARGDGNAGRQLPLHLDPRRHRLAVQPARRRRPLQPGFSGTRIDWAGFGHAVRRRRQGAGRCRRQAAP